VREKMITFLREHHPYALPRLREEHYQHAATAADGANGAARPAE